MGHFARQPSLSSHRHAGSEGHAGTSWSSPGAAVALLTILGALLSATTSLPTHSNRPSHLATPSGWPTQFAWTWDRADDLRFLPPGTGIAAVRLSVELDGSHVRLRANHGALMRRADTFMLPVVHVDALASWHPTLDAAQEDTLVAAIVDVALHTGARAVLVDFEALPSQREFYRRVLGRVRLRLPLTYLSITGLASWCLADRWTADLPVDEVVGMAFRMGPEGAAHRRAIHGLADWPAGDCTGVATDEPGGPLPRRRALYLFSPRPWTPVLWQTTLDSNT
jgi:hypothetical protein